jgi:alpha-1,6-mannosyltransferase
MSGPFELATARAAYGPGKDVSSLYRLALIGALILALTVAAPFAFQSGGDNAFIALAIPAGLLTIAAAVLAERAPPKQALWIVVGLAVALRIVAISFPPLLSTDIYRYIWDGTVQAADINPYRYVPADPALAALRDPAIFPHINRAGYAVTIYPPVAQFFFLLVTRFGANTVAMRLALLVCEAVSAVVIVLLLRRTQQPLTRVVAYLWHPLPVWEIANNGHIDGLMLCLMLLGIWLALSSRRILGAVLIALAALVKPFAAPALAVLWRPWNWIMALAVTAAVALCYAPYLSVGWGVFGFAKGYLTEEGVASGNGLWLLSLWRAVFGVHRGDVVVYLALAVAAGLTLVVWIWRRGARDARCELGDINMLLLAALVLLSPNYPWYFLAVMPFVALCGNAPTWAATIGALLLTNEVDWDFHIPTMISKSILFGSVLLLALVVAARRRAAAADRHAGAQ